MAALHESLKSLAPVTFDSISTDAPELNSYLRKHFLACQLLIDSVPPPPPPPTSGPYTGRNRSGTASSTASGISDISQSAARSEPPVSEHELLQKEWGKPLKMSAKENPLGIGVYKLSGKDGRGAWFARRSVHEGLSFDRWKAGLEKEFPESVEVEGGPGAGKVRGIGGERRVERVQTDEGTMEVYHLSAQFPGPSAPRDFVTLLLTSESALGDKGPRHYMIISKPCDHKDTPPRDGFVRGQYESVEFIREVPSRPQKVTSSVNLLNPNLSPSVLSKAHTNEEHSKSTEAVNLHGQVDTKLYGSKNEADALSPSAAESSTSDPSRSRGKTISLAESRGRSAQGGSVDLASSEGDEDEISPVEWIMITRSDPGGSVPRFMVERGTPSGIVSDAGKFLDWACKKELSTSEETPTDQQPVLKTSETYSQPKEPGVTDDLNEEPDKPSSGFVANMSNAVYAAYAAMTDHASQADVDEGSSSLKPSNESLRTSRSSSVSTIDSFASAEDYHSDPSTKSGDVSKKPTPQEKEAQRLEGQKSNLITKLTKAKESAFKDKDAPTEKETARMAKIEEKHAREMVKAEQRYTKAIQSLEDKKVREEKKEADRQAKRERKEEEKRAKAAKEDTRAELELLRAEHDLLKETVLRVQLENTKLVALVGKLEGGEAALQQLKEDEGKGLGRSSSLKDVVVNGES